MKKKVFFASLFLIIIFAALERVYYWQNQGFRLCKLISIQPCVDTPPPPGVDALLDQSFRYIGGGGTSFVFLGEDGKTVLKLFKHQHLFFKDFFFHFNFPGAMDSQRIRQILFRERKNQHKRHPFFFKSCSIAFNELKEETGLVYLCVQPNLHFNRNIQLIDAWGISHSFNLSKTEFALQEKAQLLLPYLEELLKQGHLEEAKQAIDSLAIQIVKRCQKGISDRDPNLRINFGYIGKKAVEIDLGSYDLDPSLKSSFKSAKELFFVTSALQSWLKKRSPELLDHLLEKIEEISSSAL